MRTRLALVAAAVVAVVGPAGAQPAIDSLELANGTLAIQSAPDGGSFQYFVGSAGLPWIALDVLVDAQQAHVPLATTHVWDSGLRIAVESAPAGAPPGSFATSFFRAGAGGVTNPPLALRDTQSSVPVPPVAVRPVTLDSGDEATYDFDSIATPNGAIDVLATSFFRSVGGLSIETEVVDFKEGGATHVTSIPFDASSDGPFAAAFAPQEGGGTWGAFAGPQGISLYDMIDPSAQIVATLPAPSGFDPESLRLGIIAILIGQVLTPVPAISFQAGDQLFLAAYDGNGGFDPVAQQSIQSGATGLIEHEGIFYYVTDGTSNTILVGEVAASPDTRIELGDVTERLDTTTPATSPTSFESAGSEARLEIASGYAPAPAVDHVEIAAAGDARLRSVADLDLPLSAAGRRGVVQRGVFQNQGVGGSYASVGEVARSFVLDIEQLPSGDPFDPAVDAQLVQNVNPAIPAAALSVFDDADGAESLAVLGAIGSGAGFDWQRIEARSFRSEVVPQFWLFDGTRAAIENVGIDAPALRLSTELHESSEAQTALAVTPSSFVVTGPAGIDGIDQFTADAASALGADVDVLAYSAARSETVDGNETLAITLDRAAADIGAGVFLYWGDGFAGSGTASVAIEVENDETHWIGHLFDAQGSVAELDTQLAGTALPLLADQPWDRVTMFIAGDPDQPIVLGLRGAGVVRSVPEPDAHSAFAAALLALAARRRIATRYSSG